MLISIYEDKILTGSVYLIFSMLSVNCSYVSFIYVKIYEKISSGGLEVSLSIFMILTDAFQLLTSFLAKSLGYSFALLGMFPFAPLVTSSLRSHSFCSDEIFVSPAAICRQVSPDLVCFSSTERHLSGFRRSRISVTKEKSRVSRANIKGVLPLLGTWNEAP